MQSTLLLSTICGLALLPLNSLTAAEAVATAPAAQPAASEINQICPVSGKSVDPKITVVYEECTYAFADAASRTKFNELRANSLYQKLGGKAALDAVIDAFYVKVLADDRIKGFFADVKMDKQRRRQKEFLAAAFGGPIPWKGKDLRKAHASLTLTEADFNAVAENLQKTLEDFKVKPELIAQVMTIAASTRDAVLDRDPVKK